MMGKMIKPWNKMPPITVSRYKPNLPATTFKSSISIICATIKKNIPIGDTEMTQDVIFIIIVLVSVTRANNVFTLPCIVLIAMPHTQALTTNPIMFIPLP